MTLPHLPFHHFTGSKNTQQFFIIIYSSEICEIYLRFFLHFQHRILIFSFSSRVKIISPVFIFVIPYLSYLTAELFGLSSILAWVLFLFLGKLWLNMLEKFEFTDDRILIYSLFEIQSSLFDHLVNCFTRNESKSRFRF